MSLKIHFKCIGHFNIDHDLCGNDVIFENNSSITCRNIEERLALQYVLRVSFLQHGP